MTDAHLEEIVHKYSDIVERIERLEISWDNAPHHQEIYSFPHHRHVGRKIEVSEETDLGTVLSFIRDFLR